MNRGVLIGRFVVAIAIWSLLLYINYRTALRSILPISDAIWLPHFVLPAGLVLLTLSQLIVAVTAKRRDDLLDTQATVVVKGPQFVRFGRVGFAVLLLISGYHALTGPLRPDLLYSTPEWGWAWIAFGVWTLVNTPFQQRGSVEISPAGISHGMITPAPIPWEDIAEVKPKRWLLSTFVVAHFRDGTDYRMSSPLWRWRKVRRLVLMPYYFGMDEKMLSEALNLRRAAQAF